MTNMSQENTNTAVKEKAESTAQTKEKKKKRFSLIEYFKGVRLEMKKVVWPTPSELKSYTIVVLAICIAFALAFWGVDTGVLAAIKAVCF